MEPLGGQLYTDGSTHSTPVRSGVGCEFEVEETEAAKSYVFNVAENKEPLKWHHRSNPDLQIQS